MSNLTCARLTGWCAAEPRLPTCVCVCVYACVSLCACLCVSPPPFQAGALLSPDYQRDFARDGDITEAPPDVHPQRYLTVRHTHQRVIDQLLAGDADGSKYGYIGWAVNLVYLPPVSESQTACGTVRASPGLVHTATRPRTCTIPVPAGWLQAVRLCISAFVKATCTRQAACTSFSLVCSQPCSDFMRPCRLLRCNRCTVCVQ